MLGWTLRIILLLIVIRIVWQLIAAIIEGVRGPVRKPELSEHMVRDPVCGTFVVQSQALTYREGAEVRYFCSDRCRKAFEAR